MRHATRARYPNRPEAIVKTTDQKTKAAMTPTQVLREATSLARAAPSNDNAKRGDPPDTTKLVAHPEVVRYVRATLRRCGVAARDMPDAIADAQVESIAAARAGRMPTALAQWKALAAAVAAHWAIKRQRDADVRAKYDAGLCDNADDHASLTMHWERRDPVDTKRYLAVLKDLFDSDHMPEDAAEILWGEAEEVRHAEIAAELGVTESIVRNRLFRMRLTFRTKFTALGMLVLVLALLLLAVLWSPSSNVAAPPQEQHRWDGGAPNSRDSSSPVR